MELEHTIAVTVSYGSRSHVLIPTVQKALAAGADEVVVIDNGCSAASRARLVDAFGTDARVHLGEPSPNEGSAVGFGSGIRIALQRRAAYLWLLDDDNWVHADALRELAQRAADLPVGSALCSLRTGDALQSKIARGELVEDVYPRPGDFFGVDLVDRLMKSVRAVSETSVERLRTDAAEGSVVPFAPYGGFFAAASTFRAIGYPNADFFLYEDDTEYTERITVRGGQIHLVETSLIDDADGKWIEGVHKSGIAQLITAADERRLYYATRNRARVDFQRARRCRRRGRVAMNLFVFSLVVIGRAITLRRLRRGFRIVSNLIIGVGQADRGGPTP
jgi:GT2 family glycosyltransferase